MTIDLKEAISAYDKIDQIIPGFQWGEHTKVVVDAARKLQSLRDMTDEEIFSFWINITQEKQARDWVITFVRELLNKEGKE